jgi:amidase
MRISGAGVCVLHRRARMLPPRRILLYPIGMSEPSTRSALSLAVALRSGELTSERLTAACLERIATRNPALGALVEVWPERALRRARAFDRARASGHMPRGIFAGVPTAIKDTDPSRGAYNRMGSRFLRHLWSPVDGPVARRVRGGGFHVIARSATSELALLPVVETDIHPPCRNPGALEYTAGGSSGGAASAVGGGLLPIAHASDAAGSIRIPASLCGLVGFKPSRGVLPSFYPGIDSQQLCAVNCVATTVDDSAAFLDALIGRDYAADAPAPDSYLAAARREPARLRVCVCTASPVSKVAPEVEAAVRQAAERLGQLGHELIESPPMHAELDEFLPIWQRMAANMPVPPGDRVQPTTRWLRETGGGISRARAAELTRALSARILAWFGEADAWLMPTVGVHAPRVFAHKAQSAAQGEAQFRALAPLGAFTAPFNLTGQPALTLPYGRFASGVGIGVQLVGRRGRDAELLALARQLAGA